MSSQCTKMQQPLRALTVAPQQLPCLAARYLACSVETKSEIVAPIFVRNKVIGELDIDSISSPPSAPKAADLVGNCLESRS